MNSRMPIIMVPGCCGSYGATTTWDVVRLRFLIFGSNEPLVLPSYTNFLTLTTTLRRPQSSHPLCLALPTPQALHKPLHPSPQLKMVLLSTNPSKISDLKIPTTASSWVIKMLGDVKWITETHPESQKSVWETSYRKSRNYLIWRDLRAIWRSQVARMSVTLARSPAHSRMSCVMHAEWVEWMQGARRVNKRG